MSTVTNTQKKAPAGERMADWADGRSPGDVMLNPADYHPNALGHRLIANRVLERLREQPLALPECRP